MLHHAIYTTLLPLLGSSGAGNPPVTPPNIVLILADDMGVDMVGAYQALEGSMDVPCTPSLDGLASDGILFRNAWTNPTCSPSRAQILTGRYGFRTGVGSAITSGSGELPPGEETIPELLARSGYRSAAFGKWHLGTGPSDPFQQGFSYYAGSLAGQGGGGTLPCYYDWTKTVLPTGTGAGPTTVYATTDTANEAILTAAWMEEPWFLYVSFNAPHSPHHEPPQGLCPQLPDCTSNHCDGACVEDPPCDDDKCKNEAEREVRAMIEALDTTIGRMLTAIRAVDPDVIVIFMGDNGTAAGLGVAPFNGPAKGSLYEGGVNVPLIVNGPVIEQDSEGSVCNGLVTSADLVATIIEISGGTTASIPTPNDSVSMVPYFTNPNASLRDTVYTEKFSNFDWPDITNHERAIRNDQYKLIRRTLGSGHQVELDELYDLSADPFEATDLSSLVGESGYEDLTDNYYELVLALQALGVD